LTKFQTFVPSPISQSLTSWMSLNLFLFFPKARAAPLSG
jgi:hypothetical protein